MFILALFAFIAGVVTILSPCILPILPVVLSGSLEGGKKRPLGIITGFIASFTFFTLFLSQIVKIFGFSANSLRNLSVIVIFIFGLTLLVPKLAQITERLFTKFSSLRVKTNKGGYWGGVIIGLSIGLIWTPCVGPILASVISLALSGNVGFQTIIITLSYSIGTAIPMFIITYSGGQILTKVPWLTRNSQKIQRVFGFVMILLAISIFFNYDRKFQTFILNKFPSYGVGLTKFEDNSIIKNSLDKLGSQNNQEDMGKTTQDLIDEGVSAPEIIPGGEWFNLPSGQNKLTLKELRGKVVLVDFWTYTCINCIRTLPYLSDWYKKYEKDGFVIIGVHTPEFEFEKDPKNLAKALSDYKITYPVVQDNNYATWNAYSNHYWPAKYLIDKNGKIRFTHFGEGQYDEFEGYIQKLLEEKGSDVSKVKIQNPNYSIDSLTPELYLGYKRMGYFASKEAAVVGKEFDYHFPDELPLNHFAFNGTWTISDEWSKSSSGSKLILGFQAKNVYLVMRPTKTEGKVKIYLDEKDISSNDAGEDVKDAIVTVDSDRLYSLVKLTTPGKHTITIEFLDEPIEVFAFTFG